MANRFVGLKVPKKVKFLGEDIEIVKLSVSQVIKIQEAAKLFEESSDVFGNLKLLSLVIRSGAKELIDLTEEEFNDFPVDELSQLSEQIMQYSGLVLPTAK